MGSLRKCVVWDLDNTLWDGVCLEENVEIKPEISRVVRELDSRGILNSIASRGDESLALSILEKNNLKEYFLVPQINWLPKSNSILKISSELNIGLDAIAFVDDDQFELQQIRYMLPDVLTFPADQADCLPQYPEFSPSDITAEAGARRKLYQAENERTLEEANFATRKEFLLFCGMKLTIRQITEADISRVLELMTRTHQLNTTGKIFSREEIRRIYQQKDGGHKIVAAELEDRFGWYGIIGVAMYETLDEAWRLNYLAISCRVMGRGIEKAILLTLVKEALNNKYNIIEAEFNDTGRNKMMRGLYQMSGFVNNNKSSDSGHIIYTALPNNLANIPSWIEVI